MLPATRVDASSMHLRDMDVVSSSAQSARGSTTFQRRLGLGSFSLTCAIRTRPSQPFSRRAAGRSQVHLSGSLDQADCAASERRDDGAVHCNGGGTENQDQSQSWATSPPHRHCCEAHPTVRGAAFLFSNLVPMQYTGGRESPAYRPGFGACSPHHRHEVHSRHQERAGSTSCIGCSWCGLRRSDPFTAGAIGSTSDFPWDVADPGWGALLTRAHGECFT